MMEIKVSQVPHKYRNKYLKNKIGSITNIVSSSSTATQTIASYSAVSNQESIIKAALSGITATSTLEEVCTALMAIKNNL